MRGSLPRERFLFDVGNRKLRIASRAKLKANGRVDEFMATPIT